MQKDVIYIDVEDDITAIIGKVKASTAHIVALVPPKRLGAIQSAVNLKLVHRAAEQADKRLVIISNNAALVALAASAGIPVAKNLQSKPELAEVTALDVDDGEDVIDGAELNDAAPVSAEGEPANSSDTPTKTALGATAVAKAKAKIPNFDSFRKKLFIGITAAVLLIGFLVWALVFAPRATIIVTARTSNSALTTKATVGDSLSTSLKDGTIKSITKSTKKDFSAEGTATGKKDVGDKATGTVVMQACSSSFPPTPPSAVPSGTTLSSNGNQYVTTSAASFTFDHYGSGCAVYKSGTVGISAAESGTAYNVSGASFTVSGASGVTAQGSASGGTDKTITVVQQSDIDITMNTLVNESDVSAAKSALQKQFGDDYIVLSESFKQDTSGVKPNPALDAEASDGKFTLSGSVNFTMTAVAKSELSKFLDAYFAQQIDGKNDQKVYDNGVNGAEFTSVAAATNGFSVNITANGKIGPKIDEEALKVYAKGKRYGEIQSYVEQINGVDSVDVKFSPFWVQSAPNDTKKITVEFKVND